MTHGYDASEIKKFSLHFDFSYDLNSLHSEVSPSLLPKYLGGAQDKEMTICVEKAKQLDGHFLKNIRNARFALESGHML